MCFIHLVPPSVVGFVNDCQISQRPLSELTANCYLSHDNKQFIRTTQSTSCIQRISRTGLPVLEFTDIAVIAAAVFVVAGIVKGTVGIGMPTVSISILSQIIPPHTAVALVVFPLLASNLWQVVRTRAGLRTLRRYAILATCLFVTLWLTTFLTVQVSAELLLGIIGVSIVIFSISSLVGTPPALSDRNDRMGQAVTGVSAGVLGGLTGIWSPPLVTYLIARRTDNEEFVRAAGLLILIGGVPLTLGFWQTGLLNGETAPISFAMIVPTLIGFTLGEMIRQRLHPDRFRSVILWVFLLMGLNLLRRAIL